MLTVYFDGSITFNPGGEMGYAYIIYQDGDKILTKYNTFVPEHITNTNNVSEANALICALQWLDYNQLNNERIMVLGDSEIVIKKVKNECRMKDKVRKTSPVYVKCIEELWKLKRLFEDIDFEWIPREENEADILTRREENKCHT